MIEKEFECLYVENVSLKDKLENMTERLERESIGTNNDRSIDTQEDVDGLASFRSNSSTASKVCTDKI